MLGLRRQGNRGTRRSAKKWPDSASPSGAMTLGLASRSDRENGSRVPLVARSAGKEKRPRTRGTPNLASVAVTLTAFALVFIAVPGSSEQGRAGAQEVQETAAPSAPEPLHVDARAWALVEADTGIYLAGKNADERLPIASTTNVMTALVALEEGVNLDEEVTISDQAERFVGFTYSNVGLIKGERLSVRELLVASLVPSGTEAVYALAEHVGGGGGRAGVERFVAKMNLKAEEMGLENTHFEDPAGLDDREHYSSARDLAAITRKAMHYRAFADIVETKQTTISTQARTIAVFNTSDLLYEYGKANGVKTGTSTEGGFSLVASAQSDDESYVAVVLAAGSERSRSEAASKALDYGFDGYERRPLVQEGRVYKEARLPYRHGETTSLVATADVMGPAGPGLEVERRVTVGKPPVSAKANQELGVVEVFVNGRSVGSSPLVTQSGYDEASLWAKARHAVLWPVGWALSTLSH